MVRIRLQRGGKKKHPIYRIVVADQRASRDGKFIEKLGLYNPNTNPATIDLNFQRALDWVMEGAQPTDTARRILSYKGVLYKKHLQVGVNKGAFAQEEADKKFEAWLEDKIKSIEGKSEAFAAQLEAEKKARFDAETKVKQAREEAAQKEVQEAQAAEEAAKAETETTEEPASEEPAAENTEEKKEESAE